MNHKPRPSATSHMTIDLTINISTWQITLAITVVFTPGTTGADHIFLFPKRLTLW